MFFSKLKEKTQKAYRIKSNDELLLTSLMSMFVYDGLPDELMDRQNMIEETLLLKGACAIWKYEGKDVVTSDTYDVGKWIVSQVAFSECPDVYGMGNDVIVTTENGLTRTYKNYRENPDIVVIFNNSSFSPDMLIGKTSDMLSELETSEKLQVIFSRLYPIPIAKNSKVQAAIETAINNMLNGKIATILDEDALSKYISEATKAAIESISLTEPEQAQYIQYLSDFHNDIMRRFYTTYGLSYEGAPKRAQQSVDETNRGNEASFVIPHDMLLWRQRGMKECQSKFGWPAGVAFSECWKAREEDIDVADEETEVTEDDTNSPDDSDTDTKGKEDVKEKEDETE